MINLIKKCSYSALAIVLTLGGCASKARQQESKIEQPNILFILSDDHTSQAWGIYGGILSDYVQNKSIDRLASEGMVLNNAFAPIVSAHQVGGVY